jgi:ribosome recycling factor
MSKPDLNKFKDRMDKAISALKEEFSGLRTGRANIGLVEPIHVEAYGSSVPLNSVGAISVPEPRMISINVWDKGLVIAVEKAIRNANLGLNPITDGTTLRIPIPPLTEELKKLEKAGDISEDDRKRYETETQGFTDQAVKRIDESLKTKEQEIMQV